MAGLVNALRRMSPDAQPPADAVTVVGPVGPAGGGDGDGAGGDDSAPVVAYGPRSDQLAASVLATLVTLGLPGPRLRWTADRGFASGDDAGDGSACVDRDLAIGAIEAAGLRALASLGMVVSRGCRSRKTPSRQGLMYEGVLFTVEPGRKAKAGPLSVVFAEDAEPLVAVAVALERVADIIGALEPPAEA